MRIRDMNVFRKDRDSRLGGGVIIYTDKSYNFKTAIFEFACPASYEHIWIYSSSSNLMVNIAYIPPNLRADDHKAMTKYITKCLDNHLYNFPKSNVIMIGDFNDFCTKF